MNVFHHLSESKRKARKHRKYSVFRAYRGRGIPAGGSAAFQAALLKNDPLDHSYRLRRRSGSNPFMHTKKDALQASFFMCTGEEGFEPP